MTPAQAQALLSIAASYDNRKASEEVAIAWSHALNGLRFEDCRDAIVTHVTTKPDVWLGPGHIVAEVKRIRAKRISDHPPITPPPSLADDPAAQIAWRQEAIRRIGDGQQIDCDAAYGELKPRHLHELRALMPAPNEETSA